ncbi:MAG: M48 family metallopeptidase [Candidatus Methylacidiphilales bacterium]|nr:M48 family metallopeptidase [Candidatus Methylacidiphilales bacterium]
MKRQLSTLLSTLLAFSLLCVLVSCVTLDESGKSAFLLTSPEQEAQMGSASFNQLKQSGKTSADPVANAQVQRVAQRLIPQVNVPGAKWEVVVFDDPTPNAFALPGGKIGVHTGILPLTQTDDGLAAVLGHELAHVTLRHGGQRVSQQMAVQLGAAAVDVGLAMNDVRERGYIMSGLGVGATVGIILPFSRSHEYEADRYGLIYMARAGYNPEEAVAFWQRMKAYSEKQGNKPPEWLSTHPADENRIAQLQQLLPEAMKERRKAP